MVEELVRFRCGGRKVEGRRDRVKKEQSPDALNKSKASFFQRAAAGRMTDTDALRGWWAGRYWWSVPSPDAALGDGDGAARHPYH
jgi:hypothetical protein